MEKVVIGGATLYRGDCLKAMRQMPDNAFSLAIVDPPYGIGAKFKGGNTGKMNFNEIVDKGWDEAPSGDYFKELRRVSQNQIIWGGNYFDLPPTRCFIVWDKLISEDFSLAMVELAWTSFDKLAKKHTLPTPKGGKIHPTEKPIKLYKWLLQNYAKPGDTILDTHHGSGSNAIACLDMGFSITAYEIDADYFKAACERIERSQQQYKLAL